MFATATSLSRGPTRGPTRAAPPLDLLPGPDGAASPAQLVRGRVHEACGPARHRFALWLAAQCRDEVLWIRPDWGGDMLNPCGIAPFVNPARLIFVQATRAEDVLWCAEEALRAGAAALVVTDLPALPGLTAVRRLHLAAEAGGRSQQAPPTGLLLTPGQGGAQGVESRWHLRPAHKGKPGRWELARLRARMAPEARWQVQHVQGRVLPQIMP